MCWLCIESWFEEYATLVQVLLTLALVIVTGIYAAITRGIAKANRDLVRATERMAQVTEKMAEATSTGLLLQIAPVIAGARRGWRTGSSEGGAYKVSWKNAGKGAASHLELEVSLKFNEAVKLLGQERLSLIEPGESKNYDYPFEEEVKEWLVRNEAQVETIFVARYTDGLGHRFESTQSNEAQPVVLPFES